VHTISKDSKEVGAGRRRRRVHSVEFKAQVVAACSPPGVSIAAIAMANGVNANLARRWVVDAERLNAGALSAVTSVAVADAFVPLQLPPPASASTPVPATDIRVELRRGATIINVSWPVAAASQCAVWMRSLLR